MSRNYNPVPTGLLETNLDREISQSKHSVYSLQSVLESEGEEDFRSIISLNVSR